MQNDVGCRFRKAFREMHDKISQIHPQSEVACACLIDAGRDLLE